MEVCQAFNIPILSLSLKEQVLQLATLIKAEAICVTKGADGAVLYHEDQFYSNPGYKVEVIDTVGSGDSFLGSLIHDLIHQEEPQKAIDSACAIGALVASQAGATPDISTSEIENLIKDV